MKSGAFVFLAAFMALTASWSGFVLAPQVQLGRATQTNAVPSGGIYPLDRLGLAKQGAEVYRSLGCVYCHSQQVGQEKTICEVVLTDAGTNAAATLAMVAKLNSALVSKGANDLGKLPKAILEIPSTSAAEPFVKEFQNVGAKAEARVTPQGPDIARGWGRRASVAQDYLYDLPVQLGARRIGPDLANVGLRLPDANWHLRHLYAPQSEVIGSPMPAYRFLFEERKIAANKIMSADAIPLTAAGVFFDASKDTGPAAYELVPKPEARALAAYLVSLRADAPLFEAPFTAPEAAPPPTTATNSPAK